MMASVLSTKTKQVPVCVFRFTDYPRVVNHNCSACHRPTLNIEPGALIPKGISWQYPPELVDGVCPSKF